MLHSVVAYCCNCHYSRRHRRRRRCREEKVNEDVGQGYNIIISEAEWGAGGDRETNTLLWLIGILILWQFGRCRETRLMGSSQVIVRELEIPLKDINYVCTYVFEVS